MFKQIGLYIKLIRPVNFIIAFVTIMVAGFICKSGNYNFSILIIAAFAGALTGAGGNVINDYFDYDIDKINRPNRVLPSGNLTKLNALIFYLILLFLIALLTINLNITSVIIVLVANITIFFYSYKLKGVVLVGNLVVSFFTGMAFIYGGAAVGNIEEAVVPALFAFNINFIREIIKDAEDAEGDFANGVVTFPIVFGIKRTKTLVFVLAIIMAIGTIIPYYAEIYKIEYFVIIMTVFNPLLIYSLKLLIKGNSIKIYGKVSMILKLLMVIGIIAIYLGFKN